MAGRGLEPTAAVGPCAPWEAVGVPAGLLCGASSLLVPGRPSETSPRGENLPRSRLATLWFHQQPLGVTVASATRDRQGQGRGPGDRGSLPPILTPAGQGTGAVRARADTVSADSPQAPRVRRRVATWERGPEAGPGEAGTEPEPRQPFCRRPPPRDFSPLSAAPPRKCPAGLGIGARKETPLGSCRMPGGISVPARGAAGSGRAGSERTRLPARLRLGASSAHRASGPLPRSVRPRNREGPPRDEGGGGRGSAAGGPA